MSFSGFLSGEKASVKTLEHVNVGEALGWSHYTGYVSFLPNIGRDNKTGTDIIFITFPITYPEQFHQCFPAWVAMAWQAPVPMENL
jgi:hypothetical protein